KGRQGDAPKEPTRRGANPQAQDLRRAGAPSQRTGAEADGARRRRLDGAGAGAVTEIAQYRGTGKRKTSVARVILRPGDGKTWINGRTLEEYFTRPGHRSMVL